MTPQSFLINNPVHDSPPFDLDSPTDFPPILPSSTTNPTSHEPEANLNPNTAGINDHPPDAQYSPSPTIDPSLPFDYPILPIPTTFEFTHSPWADLDAFVLTPDACLPSHLQFCPFPTNTKCLPSRQRELVAHCITLVAEKIVSSEGVDIARWLSVYHLIPRLLLLSSLHKRMNIDTPSACHPPSSTFRTPSRGRRVGAPRDLAADAFETRVRAFLNGRFFELLSSTLDLTIAPNSPQNQSQYPLDTPPPTRSLRSRALEVRDLV